MRLLTRCPLANAPDRDCAPGHACGQRGTGMASDGDREGQRLASANRGAGLAVPVLALVAGAAGLWLGQGQGLLAGA